MAQRSRRVKKRAKPARAVQTCCPPCGMSYGVGVRRVGQMCHSSTGFPDTYMMTMEEWCKQVRIRNLYYEECAHFCRRPVVKWFPFKWRP